MGSANYEKNGTNGRNRKELKPDKQNETADFILTLSHEFFQNQAFKVMNASFFKNM